MSKSDRTLAETDMAKASTPACPVCGASNWSPFREGTDIRRPEERLVFKIDQCRSCGHLMQNPLPSHDELSQAYAVEYAPYRPAWKENRPSIWKLLRDLTTLRRMHRLKKFAHGKKLMEVGCGAGDFLHAANQAGWRVAGVEYNQKLAETLRSELNFDIRAGELEPGLWPGASFDAVILWSVLEHVLDPVAFMKLAASYLRSGGTMLLQFPTAQGLSHGRIFSTYWEILDLPRHINYFDQDSLSALCQNSDLELKVYKTTFLDLAWCWYTSSMNFANGAGGKLSKFLRLAILAPITILVLPYLALLAWRGHGTEAWAVATKR